jgi:hypothetical protein
VDVVLMAKMEALVLECLEPLVRLWEEEFPDGTPDAPHITYIMEQISESVRGLRRLRGRDGN